MSYIHVPLRVLVMVPAVRSTIKLIAILDVCNSIRAGENWQSDVDGIAIEYAGKAFGDDARYTSTFDCQGRVLTR